MVVHDRIMNETCLASREYAGYYFSTYDRNLIMGCDDRFEDIIQGYQTY